MWIFSDMFTFISWKFCSIVFTRCLQSLDFVFPKKLFITASTDNQVYLSRSVKLFSKSQSNISCRICSPWKTLSLILASLSLGNFLFKERKTFLFLSIALTKFLTMPSFTCNSGNKFFLRINKWFLINVHFSRVQRHPGACESHQTVNSVQEDNFCAMYLSNSYSWKYKLFWNFFCIKKRREWRAVD